MSRYLMLVGLITLGSVAVPRTAAAQTDAGALIREARDQIDQLDIPAAGVLLRSALAPESNATRSQRIRGLVLLGITELILGQQLGARQAFQQALALDPRLRVDSLAELSSDLLPTFNSVRPAEVPPAQPRRETLLEVRGVPSDAELQVDGTVWATPRQRVEPGPRRIVVRGRGYVAVETTVTVREGQTAVHDVSLERAAPALLSVTSEPWGVVYLDGERIGETPIIARRVPAWDYTMTLEIPGQPRYEQSLTLAPGDAVLLSTPGRLAPSERSPFPFTRADSLYLAAAFADAETLYRRVLDESNLSFLPEQRARAATMIGMLFYGRARSADQPALFDSAQVYFRDALRFQPDYTPETGLLGPDFEAAFDLSRAGAFRVNVLATADTVIDHRDGALTVTVVPSLPATITMLVTRDVDSAVIHGDTVRTSETVDLSWGLDRIADSVRTGRYTVRVDARDAGGAAAPLTTLAVEVADAVADTLLMPPALSANLFRPEEQSINRGFNLVRGAALGGLAVGLSWWSAVKFDPEIPFFSTRTWVVAGTFSVAGIVGLVAGKKARPLPQNVAYNAGLRAQDAEERAEIAVRNREIRRNAGIRLTVERRR